MSRSSVYDRRMSRTMSLAFESAAVVPPDMAARARKMSLTLEAAMRPALDPRRLSRTLEAAMRPALDPRRLSRTLEAAARPALDPQRLESGRGDGDAFGA